MKGGKVPILYERGEDILNFVLLRMKTGSFSLWKKRTVAFRKGEKRDVSEKHKKLGKKKGVMYSC